MPTDTVYGLVGQALNPLAAAKIKKLKERRSNKPFIILLSALADLRQFNLKPPPTMLEIIKQVWPGPVSIIFTKKLSFRLPAPIWLRRFIRQTGPLIATSANIAGAPPSRSILQAKKYFGRRVDFYLPGESRGTKPSTLIKIRNGKIIVLRS